MNDQIAIDKVPDSESPSALLAPTAATLIAALAKLPPDTLIAASGYAAYEIEHIDASLVSEVNVAYLVISEI